MKLLTLKKRITACMCGAFMLFGIGGVVTAQYSSDNSIVVEAAADTVIGLDASCYINNESSASRFRLPFNSPICDKNAGTANAFQAGTLSDLNGLEDKLLIAGKTPREWSELNVGFSISFRTSQQPVFSFDKNKLGALKQNFFNGPFVVELKEDCVLNNNYGTVKAFAVYSDATGGSTKVCGTNELVLKSSAGRPEGPFYYEGVSGGMLQVKMWFDTAVIQANGSADTNIDIDKMEGLQHALYFNGKSLAEWSLAGALGTVTARSGGGFVFRFNTASFDTSKEYLIEIKDELQTTKGVIQPFTYQVKAGLTFGNFNNSDGTPNGNGTLIERLPTKPLSLKQDRVEGPFYYEGVSGGMLQVKMWFAEAVIEANGASDANISIDKMEGLENALYFNGKSLAEWNAEGALGTITARSAGGFIFRFNTAKFDYSKAYLIEIKEEVQTTKGLVQPFAYWVKGGFNFGNFFNGDGTATGNGYVYQGKTLEFNNSAFELNINNANTLKMWFNDGADVAPVVSADNGDNLASGVGHLEGLQDVLKIDGKTIAEWEALLGDGFSIGSRARDGRFTPYFNIASLGENNFIGKNFVVELENDCMTSQGVVKAFKYVYSWALGEGVVNPAEEEVKLASVSEVVRGNEYFYFDVTFDKAVVATAPATNKVLTGDDLQKLDLSDLVKVNGKDVATAIYSIEVVAGTTDTLRFSVLNTELAATAEVELLAGYVFPNGNVLCEGETLILNVFPTTSLTLKQDRVEGPFYYEGVSGGMLQVKMWFAEAVIEANGASDANISIDKMEGLENALYFNGKSLAEWNAEGALGTITARSAGGFIFRFNTAKFDYSKAYLIEIKEEVQTTKGLVQPFAYWVKGGFNFGNFFNGDGTATGNGYVYQGKTLEFNNSAFELNINNANTLKMWFNDGADVAPVVSADNGDNLASGVGHLEGLQDVLKIDGKTIAEWEALLGDGFSIGSRARDGRFTPYFNIASLGENNFIGKNFVVELEEDCMTSQGVVKAFKYVYNWALGEGVLNPTEEEVKYFFADSFHNMDEFFYFDVTFDKAVVATAPAVDTPLSNDALQKADLSNLVKVNGKDVATAMYSIAVVKETTNTLRFSVLNAEKSHNFNFTLLAGYVFPNGNVLAEDITLYYNEQNGTWQTTAMPNITVVYNANGGEGEMTGSTVAYGSDYLLAENTFTKLGYEFAGWARAEDGRVVFADQETLHLYVGGALENVNDPTLNLYAVWQKERGVRFMSISMAGDIGLNFYVDLDDAEEATATITMKGESTTVVGVYQPSLACWKFTYGVAPKDYQEIVSISVVDVVAEYSVAAYGEALPEDNAAYPIVAELMAYCEAARIYFAEEEATATEDLTADLSEYEATLEGTEENVTIAGATLVLESKTTINVYVTAESLEGVDCTVDGETITPVAVEGQDGQYVISISGIVSKDLDEVHTITVGGYTITYCALSYVEETLSGTVDNVALANLVKALYSLSVEAEQYFTTVE